MRQEMGFVNKSACAIRRAWVGVVCAALAMVFMPLGLAQDRGRLVEPFDQAIGVDAAAVMPRSLSELVHATERGERVLVIVGLEMPFRPEGVLTVAERRVQRDAIGGAQAALLDRLAPLEVRVAAAFRTIPFVSVHADAAVLRALMVDRAVISIVEDVPLPPALMDSVPLVGGPEAWAGGYDGAGQAVAIFDTGVATGHPFFAGRIVAEACFSNAGGGGGGTSLCPDGSPEQIGEGAGEDCDPADWGGCGHGTHVAGIAAGAAYTGQVSGPFSGVAPAAGVIAVQVFTAFGEPGAGGVGAFGTDLILALEHMLDLLEDFEIAAVNMSLGGGFYDSEEACDAAFEAEKLAVDNLRAFGTATVAASGNSGWTFGMGGPACISSVVSVGSTTKADDVSDFSDSADFLDLLAPGSAIISSVPGDAYEPDWGTSMAAPHVAGAWAVLRQQHDTASVGEILSYLKATGEPITDTRPGANDRVTPRIQVDRALDPSGIFGALQLTVGHDPDTCGSNSSTVASAGDTVYFCYTIYNAGVETAVSHHLEDTLLGVVRTGALVPPLAPGEFRSYIEPYVVTGSVSTEASWFVTGDEGATFEASSSADVLVLDYTSVPAKPIDLPPDYDDLVEDSIVISSSAVLLGLELYLDISHTWVADLEIELQHVETGTSIAILGINEPGFYWCIGSNVRAFFSDDASLDPYLTCDIDGGLVDGPYIPDQPLSTFVGQSLAGEWRLTIRDIYPGFDGGRLNSWGFNVEVGDELPECEIAWFAEHPLGDFDADGVVNVGDALLILRTAVGDLTDPSDFQRYHSDLDSDGAITVGDALLALRKAVDPTRPAALQLAPQSVSLATGANTCVLLGNAGNLALPPITVDAASGVSVRSITHGAAVGHVYDIELVSGSGGEVTFDAGAAGTRTLTVNAE